METIPKKEDPKRIEILKNMTPDQKYQAMLAINRAGRELKAAWLRKQHPDWSEQEILTEIRRIFLYART